MEKYGTKITRAEKMQIFFRRSGRRRTLKFTFGRTGEKARSGRIPAPEKAFAIKPELDLLKAFDLNFNIKLFDLAEPLDLGALPT